MTHLRPTLRRSAALAVGVAISIVAVGGALAHPESEGEHFGCIVTVEPGTVAVGGQFTVEGNFGDASIFLVEGADATVTEDAEPDATTPPGDSFSVTFTAEAGDEGTWTVWGMIVGSECGDADTLIVTGSIPDVAMGHPSALIPAGWLIFLLGVALGSRRLAVRSAGGQPAG